MLSGEEIVLDVISINKNEMYPTKEEIMHYHSTIYNEEQREEIIEGMIKQIKSRHCMYNAVIILEKGKVIEIL